MLNEVFDKEAFEKSKQEIKELCNRFENREEDYLKKTYKEAEVRKDFIDYFFKALGWDVDNTQGFSPVFREVKVEETIDVGGKSKNPDYTFQIGGQKIFFVEAKAPHVNLETNPKPANQLRRYGWNAELAVCVLTDFQEFMVYETKMMPDEKLPASAGRVKKYKYTEYVDKWEEIYTIFSKEGVMKGFFDDFANSSEVGSKTGTARVDSEFLKDIENWRLLLARNIALRNKELTLEELNLAVQLIIDRIVFFRMAEDRGIERQKTLYKLAQSDNIYEQLCEVFKKADLKYNSGLFHFNVTPDYSEFVDNITLHLNIDDGVFKEIFKNLYYPYSPYEFSIISPEILGSIYENFLGSQIRLTPSHQARIELKPEVQKAGGVYYTPQYIADYIIDNTVGELIKGKSPKQISKMKIVDPACGSGSFLLRAYQKLLDYHLEYYINPINKTPKDVYYIGKDGVPRLTIREKKRILTNNIFGVDIDVNAVEVTKLSLLLKVLEDENKDVLEQQQKLFQEKVLPNLSYNIKCGNSLVGTEILKEDLTMDEISKINPFDWEDEFKEIFDNGGFDIVIGNPPYVGEKGNKETFHPIKKTAWGKQYYYTKMDLFYFFYHKSLDICKDNGLVSLITTNYFLTADGAINLRNDFKSRATILKVINFNELQVFTNAKGQHNVIFILEKSSHKKKVGEVINIKLKGDLNSSMFRKILAQNYDNVIFSEVSQEDFFNGEDNFIFLEGHSSSNSESTSDNLISNILAKMEDGVKLKEIMEINSGADITISKITKKHVDNYGNKFIKGEGVFVLTNKEFENMDIPQEELSIVKPFIKNSDIEKYFIKAPTKKLIYTNSSTKINQYPTIKNHLIKFKKIFTDQMKRYDENYPWFMIHRPREERIFINEKIILPYRSLENKFAYSNSPIYASRDVFFLLMKNEGFDIKFLLALLNSKIYYVWLYYRGKRKGEMLELYATPVGNIPIPDVPFDEQKPFIVLAEKMIKLNIQLDKATTPKEIRLFEKQIEVTAMEINQLVYELYELTDDEIAIIEEMV